MKSFSKTLFKQSLNISVIFCALVLMGKLARKETDTFTILGISSNRPYLPEHETSPLLKSESEELKIALNQPYTYFGCGGQAYAFFSRDGQYVVKFFKQRLFKPSWWLNHIPLFPILHKYRAKRNFARADKFKRDFFSYRVAQEELQEQTGIIYSHLNPTNHLHTQLEIIDKINIHHFIDLDQFDFVVQRRAERVYDQIDNWINSGQYVKATEGLGKVFSLISTRAKMGYRDRDPNIRTNCGFIDGKAIKIDVGRFVIDDKMKAKDAHNQELIRIVGPFEKWIKEKHPELLPSFHEQVQETLL